MKKATYAEIITAIRNGEEYRMGELYDKSYNLLYFTALKRMGNQSDAEDVVSDVWEKIMEKLDTLRKPDSFPSFAYKIVVNQCNTALGKKSRELKKQMILLDGNGEETQSWEERLSDKAHEAEEDPADIIERHMLCEEINKILQERAPLDRDIFYRRTLGVGFPEIGEELNMNINTVKSNYHRTLKYVKRRCENKGMLLS